MRRRKKKKKTLKQRQNELEWGNERNVYERRRKTRGEQDGGEQEGGRDRTTPTTEEGAAVECEEKRTVEGLFAMLPNDVREKIYRYLACFVDESGTSVLTLRATCTSMRARFVHEHVEIKWRKMLDSRPVRTVWFNSYTREYEERAELQPEVNPLKITATLDALSNQGACAAPLLSRVAAYSRSDCQYVRWSAVHCCRTVVCDAIQEKKFHLIVDVPAIRRVFVTALKDNFWQVKREALQSAYTLRRGPMCILREVGAMEGVWRVVSFAVERRESEAFSVGQIAQSLEYEWKRIQEEDSLPQPAR